MLWDIDNIKGLSEEEIAERIEKYGYNELPASRRRKNIFAIALGIIFEPMFILLLVCGGFYLFLGDLEEAIMLLGFVFIVIGITLYQERKTERAIEALRDLSSPRALVIRGGNQIRIPGRNVVIDDMLILAEGDRVPADAVIEQCNNLTVDESLLTGESVPVCKLAIHSNNQKDELINSQKVFSGTLIVQGQALAKVTAIGSDTELGKIGKSLTTIEDEDSPLKKEIHKFVKDIALLGFFLCLVVIIVYGATRGNWIHGFLAGISLAMAMLPEEFPVVLTIFFALGAWRLSQKGVLTRRIPTMETLGSATVLCVDKTGTLTQNKMSLMMIYSGAEYYKIDEDNKLLPELFHEVVEYGILASKKDPFDPMEKALKNIGADTLSNTEHLHYDWTLVQEYPLSEGLRAMSQVWESPDKTKYVIASKGAPEDIIDLCHFEKKDAEELSERIKYMAGRGLRILGVAKATFEKTSLPKIQHDFKFELCGLIGFADPVRPQVSEAIHLSYNAGIRVIMITGDYPETARNIANQIGLKNPNESISGFELCNMSDVILRERLKTVNIFARVIPEQKLKIVNALKSNGEIVAMTGDGVNDAPALKAAHIGIAMGARGTDVARESSALVLLDDDFTSIVQAVRMGRKIYDNLKKAVSYILAVHVPIAGMSIIPVLLKMPLMLLPIHIAILEMIIDPACSVAFEAEGEEKNIMSRPPHNIKKRLFSNRLVGLSLLQGAFVLFVVLSVFLIVMLRNLGEVEARTLTLATLIISNLCLILTNRSWTQTIISGLKSPNKALWYVIIGTLTALFTIIYTPFLRDFFKLTILHPIDLAICIGAGVFSIVWFEIFKIFANQKR